MSSQHVPWYIKMISKIILARLPLPYSLWRRAGLFQHGKMENPEYAFRVFRRHYDRAVFPGKGENFTALELGPGDTLFSALIARAFHAARIDLVDVGSYAKRDISPYQRMHDYLVSQGFSLPPIEGAKTIDDVLKAMSGYYGTTGLSYLRELKSASVDFVWSQAMMEHVRRADFPLLLKEIRRILKPGGICSHRIDLKDHLGWSLNNLRFSESFWESDFIAKSGFYTNRIRFTEMLSHFEAAGFRYDVVHIDRWDRLPIDRKHLKQPFCDLSEEELLISGFDVLLT